MVDRRKKAFKIPATDIDYAAAFQELLHRMNWLADIPPYLLLLVIATVSFVEAFAFAGLLIPGVVVLFSLAALANAAGIHWLTLLMSGAAGGMLSDIASYSLGRKLQHRMESMNWIKQHQAWLDQGQWFIEKWGWLSVMLGRILGPLRPITPFVAGTLGMSQTVFLPVCVITCVIWAPIYLMPGYLTGELSELWTLQSIGNRMLLMYSFTGVALAAALLTIYHHMHPEHLHLRGWISRHQADRWPITSLMLMLITSVVIIGLSIAAPLKQDIEFLGWSSEWQQMSMTPFWFSVNTLVDRSLCHFLLLLTSLWLTLASRFMLALLPIAILVTTELLVIPAVQQFVQAVPKDAFFDIAVFTFYTGFVANIIATRLHGLVRWPIYFIASQLILFAVISQLWFAEIELSGALIAALVALFLNATVRALWQFLHLKRRTPPPYAFLCLVALTAIGFLTASY